MRYGAQWKYVTGYKIKPRKISVITLWDHLYFHNPHQNQVLGLPTRPLVTLWTHQIQSSIGVIVCVCVSMSVCYLSKSRSSWRLSRSSLKVKVNRLILFWGRGFRGKVASLHDTQSYFLLTFWLVDKPHVTIAYTNVGTMMWLCYSLYETMETVDYWEITW